MLKEPSQHRTARPTMTEVASSKIARILHQAGEVHHIVFADTDGNDDDWATFYLRQPSA